jgi:hypothetical protein
MSGSQTGHYGPEDIYYQLEHQGLTLVELDPGGGISWDFDPAIEPGGAGLGQLKNTYFKVTGPAKGSGKMSRKFLDRADNGYLFLDLAQGDQNVQQESIAAGATTYTVTLNTSLISILEIRGNTTQRVMREGQDYTVNYSTGVITFAAATGEISTIRYLSSAKKAANLLINGGFEDALTNIWTPLGTATIARNSANAYVEGNALAVTPGAQNDGFQYIVTTPLLTGRTYRLRFRAKAAAAETLAATWFDGTTDVAMTPASVTLTTSYAVYEFTFISTKNSTNLIKIKDTKVSPALFYVDEVQLYDDTSGSGPTLTTNPMDAGLAVSPFIFNIVGRRTVDGVVAFKLMKCAIDKLSYKSGPSYSEDISFQFLEFQGQ